MVFRLKVSGYIPTIVFLFYSFIACFIHGMICGTLGFLGAYIFVWRIYGYFISSHHNFNGLGL